jgi:hypothetical protein
VHLRMPCGWRSGSWVHSFKASQIDFTDRLRIDGRNIIHSRDLTIKGWSLPGAEADDYSQIARKAHENLLNIAASEWFGRVRPAFTKRYLARIVFLIIWYGLVVAFISYMMLRS